MRYALDSYLNSNIIAIKLRTTTNKIISLIIIIIIIRGLHIMHMDMACVRRAYFSIWAGTYKVK